MNGNTSDREIFATRMYDAPRERVFDVWTDPAHITHWWGPRGFSTTTSKMDLRPGGEWLFVMHGPDGHDYPNRVVYKEVVRPERLAYRHTGTGDNDPVRFNVTVEFVAHGARTEVKFRLVLDTREMYIYAAEHGAIEGLHDTLTRFAEQLARPGMKSEPLIVERVFEAPMELVWQAITDKDMMKHWYFELSEFRAEPGFEFEFLAGPPEGRKYLHVCKVTDVVPGRKVSYSWRFEGYEGVSEVSFELLPEGRGTRLRLTHAGLETFTHADFARENFREGWTYFIDVSLRNYLNQQPGRTA